MSDYCQIGTTTEQMRAAPLGAVFVWCNSSLDYPKRLALKIERTDLKIVSPDWLEISRIAGQHLTGLIVDHAANLSFEQMRALDHALTRVRPA